MKRRAFIALIGSTPGKADICQTGWMSAHGQK